MNIINIIKQTIELNLFFLTSSSKMSEIFYCHFLRVSFPEEDSFLIASDDVLLLSYIFSCFFFYNDVASVVPSWNMIPS